jgi:hypothetical protein
MEPVRGGSKVTMHVTDRSPMSHEFRSGERLTVLTDGSFAAVDEYSARAALLHLS